MRTEQHESPEIQGFQSDFVLFKCKVFAAKPPKPLHVSNEHCDARLKIRIVYMPESGKKTVKKSRFCPIAQQSCANKSQWRLIQQTLNNAY